MAEKPVIMWAPRPLSTSLAAMPWPTAPTGTTRPMVSSSGRARARSAGSPPAMITSLPSTAGLRVPETGASRKRPPRARTLASVTRAVSTSTVDMSMTSALGREALEDAVGAVDDGVDGDRIGEHEDDGVGAAGGVGGRGGEARAGGDERLRARGRAVPHRERVTVACDVRGHRRAHGAETEEGDLHDGT